MVLLVQQTALPLLLVIVVGAVLRVLQVAKPLQVAKVVVGVVPYALRAAVEIVLVLVMLNAVIVVTVVVALLVVHLAPQIALALVQ